MSNVDEKEPPTPPPLTDQTELRPEKLGVSAILKDGLHILMNRPVKVLILSFSVTLLFILLFALSGRLEQLVWLFEHSGPITTSMFLVYGSFRFIHWNPILLGLTAGLTAQLTVEAKCGRSSALGRYFKSILPALIPIIVLTIVIGFLTSLGLLALVIGALWVLAAFYLTASIAIIDHAGFGSMHRSFELTRHYRWQIAGMLALAETALIAVAITLSLATTYVLTPFASKATVTLVTALVTCLSATIANGYAGIIAALIYARLREIKDNLTPDKIAEGFK